MEYVQVNEAVEQFYLSLRDLKDNNKPMIAMLTMLAEENKQVDTEIVQVINDIVYEVRSDHKLPFLYLIDSICKNDGCLNYVALFSTHLVKLFAHVYTTSSDQTKHSLVKLRNNWTKIFSDNLLADLDDRLKKLDSDWPFNRKHKGCASNQNSSNINSTSSTKNTQCELQKNPPSSQTNELSSNFNQLLNIDKSAINLTVNSTIESRNQFNQPNLGENQKNLVKPAISQSNVDQHVNSLSLHPMPNNHLFQQPISNLIHPTTNNVLQSSISNDINHLDFVLPANLSFMNNSPFLGHNPPFMNNNEFLNRQNVKFNSSINNQLNVQMRSQTRRSFAKPFVYTSNFTSRNDRYHNDSTRKRFYENDFHSYKRKRNPLTRIDDVLSNQHSGKMFEKSSSLNQQMNSIQSNNMQLLDVSPNFQTNLPVNNNTINQAQQLTSKVQFSPVISGNNPVQRNSFLPVMKLPPTIIRESYIMFENKSYKIYHLDEKTSIILLNCALNTTFNQLKYVNPQELDPRLVYFDGPPVNVFVDERDAIQLHFNNQWKKFYSNGFEQYIKFGTPDREIFLNSQIIKAKFGGPPVLCKLNGDTGDHSIRLDFPAPSVKLSAYSRIDLWYDLIKKHSTLTNASKPFNSIQNDQPKQQHTSKIESATIVTKDSSFQSKSENFKSTKDDEMRSSKKSDKSSDESSNKSSKFSSKSSNKSAFRSSNRSCNNRPFNKSSNKSSKSSLTSSIESEQFLELEPESLRIRRPELIDKMYKGLQCTNCSLRFSVDTPEDKLKYSKHLDWHFRLNRKTRNKLTISRDWYYSLEEWLKFKEINLDFDERPEISQQFTSLNEIKSNTKLTLKKESIKANSDDSLNKCSVCFERFPQKWCDDEDEWILENATQIKDDIGSSNYFHPTCLISDQTESCLEINLNTDNDLIDSDHNNLICSLVSHDNVSDTKLSDGNNNSLSDLNMIKDLFLNNNKTNSDYKILIDDHSYSAFEDTPKTDGKNPSLSDHDYLMRIDSQTNETLINSNTVSNDSQVNLNSNADLICVKNDFKPDLFCFQICDHEEIVESQLDHSFSFPLVSHSKKDEPLNVSPDHLPNFNSTSYDIEFYEEIVPTKLMSTDDLMDDNSNDDTRDLKNNLNGFSSEESGLEAQSDSKENQSLKFDDNQFMNNYARSIVEHNDELIDRECSNLVEDLLLDKNLNDENYQSFNQEYLNPSDKSIKFNSNKKSIRVNFLYKPNENDDQFNQSVTKKIKSTSQIQQIGDINVESKEHKNEDESSLHSQELNRKHVEHDVNTNEKFIAPSKNSSETNFTLKSNSFPYCKAALFEPHNRDVSSLCSLM